MEVAAVGAAASFSLADVQYDAPKLKEGSQCTCVGMMTLSLVAAGVTCAILAMVVEQSTIVIVAAVISICISPVVLVQRFHLNRMSTLREVHNGLRQEVNRLTGINTDLENQTSLLSEKVERVKTVETNLQQLVGAQGGTVESFVGLVKENGTIVDAMEDLLNAQVITQLMSTVIGVDRNQDFKLSGSEIDELILRVQNIKGVEGVDENQVRQYLTQHSGVEGLYSVIQNLQDRKQKSLIQVSSRALVS